MSRRPIERRGRRNAVLQGVEKRECSAKASGLAILTVGCLLGQIPSAAYSQCVTFPASAGSLSLSCATQWSGDSVINLGGSSLISEANGINNAGQVVGFSVFNSGDYATEWSGGSVINLGGLPGSTFSYAFAINDAGQAVGYSVVGGDGYATEWSGGSVIDLGGPGSYAFGINDAGQVVGSSAGYATEWSGGSVINLGGLPGSLGSGANAINNAGQAVEPAYSTAATTPPSGAAAA